MDLQCDQEGLPRRSRLKIRRSPSCRISATTSLSFHGDCRQQIKKKGCNVTVRQPLIFHTFDPEIIVTEPAEFMWVVQRLTGSPQTRRLLRKLRYMRSSSRVADAQLMQQSNNDPLKEGTTIILAAPTSHSYSDISIDEQPPDSPSCANLSARSSNGISCPSELPLSPRANQLICNTNHPLSPHTNQVIYNTNHPLASHANQHICNTNHPLSPADSDLSTHTLQDEKLQPSSPSSTPKPNKIKRPISLLSANFSDCLQTITPRMPLPLSAKASEELSNRRGPPCSPNSCLTTSSEGYHTDNVSTEGGASPYREALCHEEGNSLEADEDGSINFFVFSGDSYYGNYHSAQDEVELLYCNVLDFFSPASSMP